MPSLTFRACLVLFFSLIIGLRAYTSLPALQFAVEEIRDSNPNIPEATYRFPTLFGSPDSVAQKINTFLSKEMLGLLPGEQDSSIFELIWYPNDDWHVQMTEMDFVVHTLNKRLLSLSLEGEGCAAYCDYHVTSFLFDMQSGQPILSDSLFSPDGRSKLLLHLAEAKRARIEAKIRETGEKIEQGIIPDTDSDYYASMIEMYRDCLDLIHISPYLFVYDVSVRRDTLSITGGRCSSRYNRALDEIGTFVHNLPLTDWMEALSVYGREVLLGE